MADEGGLALRLDRIANLMALTLVRDLEQNEQIRILAAVGYAPAEIGNLLGIRPNTVSVALTRQRARPSRKKKVADRRRKDGR